MRWRILNLANTSPFPKALTPLSAVADVVSLPATTENLERELPQADAYLSALSLRLDARHIAQAPRLKAVATPSTGWDHLDYLILEARKIPLLSLRGEEEFLDSITATAELAWGLLLAVARRLRMASRFVEEGVWARDQCRGTQLSGKTLGILGCGRLGRMMADYGRAFRMNVIACEKNPKKVPQGTAIVSLEECLFRSDVLSIHIHLTPENRGLIGREQIALMKPGAILINTSRGAIVDEAALLEALDSGRLGGAGLDVIHGEWEANPGNHPVVRFAREYDNLVLTPHIGGITWESQAAAYQFIAEKLARWIHDAEGS